MVSSTARDCQPKTQSALPLGEPPRLTLLIRILLVVVLGLGRFLVGRGACQSPQGNGRGRRTTTRRIRMRRRHVPRLAYWKSNCLPCRGGTCRSYAKILPTRLPRRYADTSPLQSEQLLLPAHQNRVSHFWLSRDSFQRLSGSNHSGIELQTLSDPVTSSF
jgi:hypothetical protein